VIVMLEATGGKGLIANPAKGVTCHVSHLGLFPIECFDASCDVFASIRHKCSTDVSQEEIASYDINYCCLFEVISS
jgi:hypothetical protein